MSDNDPMATSAQATDAPVTPAADTNNATPSTAVDPSTDETNVAETNDASADVIAEPSTEEITYHAVEKDGNITAIWEMQGRKHLRTIDPRARQGQEILRLYTAEHHES